MDLCGVIGCIRVWGFLWFLGFGVVCCFWFESLIFFGVLGFSCIFEFRGFVGVRVFLSMRGGGFEVYVGFCGSVFV